MTQALINPIVETYGAALTTGLLTGVLAGTDSAGHLGAFRWGSTTKTCYVQRMLAVWTTTTAFTAGQVVGLDVVQTRSYSASHTGGTSVVSGINLAGNNFKRWTLQADSAVTAISIATTTGLTDGTHSAITAPVIPTMIGYGNAIAADATLSFGVGIDFRQGGGPGLRLDATEGMVLRNLVLMGAGGVARVVWYIDWIEKPV